MNKAIRTHSLNLNKKYNLSKPNSLCFGNISKFPVFADRDFLGPISVFNIIMRKLIMDYFHSFVQDNMLEVFLKICVYW